ncbi:hypothetical protein [Bradyrhizobium genosp. P]|uniref:hypothetical protein n=1 Tax=Bradyrhizobium genosp. P TaxID=83641 RepID=UPI003CEF5D27
MAALLFLLGVNRGLLGRQLGNQLVDSIKHLLVKDAGGQSPEVINPSVDLDALVTHGWVFAFSREAADIGCPLEDGQAKNLFQHFNSGHCQNQTGATRG